MATTRSASNDSLIDKLSADWVYASVAPEVVDRARDAVEHGRVARPSIRRTEIESVVGDARLGRLRTRIWLDARGPKSKCECGHSNGAPCEHVAAVALLLVGDARHDAAREDDDLARSATAGAAYERNVRLQRGTSELFDVRPHPGTRVYGRYDVASPSSRSYEVDVRALDAPQNGCTCPDFATNRLGTCKHIEAALHWARRKRRTAFNASRRSGVPEPFLYLEGLPTTTLHLRLDAKPVAAVRRFAAQWFDARGLLKAPVLARWSDLEHDAIAAGVTIPGEVTSWVARQLQEAERARRQHAVEASVRLSGGAQPGFRATLYRYQVDGVAFLASRGRALLADDMGLGKTAQAIAAMMRLRHDERLRRTMIVCPASLKHQWQTEIGRFTDLPADSVRVVGGSREDRLAAYASEAAILITSYELVRSDESELVDLAPDLLVLDEAQRIRNWRTRTADAVKRIPARFAFVLTGTPMENRLDDLYSLMQVVDPHLFGPLWRFNEEFTQLDPNGRVLGYGNLDRLRARVAPVFLRRRKEEVLDQLPAQVVNKIEVPMTPAQNGIHDDARDTVGRLLNVLKRRKLTPVEEKRLMSSFQRMRMASNAAELVDPSIKGSPKLEELGRLLEEICLDGGHKVVVFSEWEKFQALAAKVCEKLKLGYVRLHGGVPSGSRGALIERFRKDPKCKVFFSTDAGGTGLNLQFASYLINMDLPWNPAVLAQRIGRIHRIGQKSVANVVLVVSKDSVEEKIESTLSAKRALFSAVVGDDSETTEVGRSTLATRIATVLGDSYAGSTRASPTAEQPVPQPTAVDALRTALGDALERVIQLADGRTVGIVRGEIPAGVDVQAMLVSAQSARDLEAFGAASPLASGEVLFRAEVAPVGDPQRATRQARAMEAERKLAAARALVAANIGSEALGLLHAAISLACRAMDERGDPGDAPAAILASVYEHSIPAGALTDSDANALARAGEMARAFAGSALPPPAALVAKIAAEAGELVARARAATGAPAPAAV